MREMAQLLSEYGHVANVEFSHFLVKHRIIVGVSLLATLSQGRADWRFVIGDNGCIEGFVVFGIPECPCQRLGRTPLIADGIAAGTLLAFLRNWTSALIIRALRRSARSAGRKSSGASRGSWLRFFIRSLGC